MTLGRLPLLSRWGVASMMRPWVLGARVPVVSFGRSFTTRRLASFRTIVDTPDGIEQGVTELTNTPKHGSTACFAEPFPLVSGGVLPEIHVRWEQWGDPNAPGERTVVICPSLSHGSHAKSHDEDPRHGWWEHIVGPGKGIDTHKYRVICASVLGAPFGTTSPLSLDPQTGRRYGTTFPQITPEDQARVHGKLVFDYLKIPKIHAVVGSSLGGMQSLMFGALFGEKVDRVVAIAATGRTSPGTVAFRRVQRHAIMSDPAFQGGNYEENEGPKIGLSIAREIGTICYRSRDEFDQRFDWTPETPSTHFLDVAFEVERYLLEAGRKFSDRFDANCYLLLSRCMDLQNLGRGCPTYAEGVLRLTSRILLVGVDRDILIPHSELLHLATLLSSHGRCVKFEVLSSIFGHDAFLKDFDYFNNKLNTFLNSS